MAKQDSGLLKKIPLPRPAVMRRHQRNLLIDYKNRTDAMMGLIKGIQEQRLGKLHPTKTSKTTVPSTNTEFHTPENIEKQLMASVLDACQHAAGIFSPVLSSFTSLHLPVFFADCRGVDSSVLTREEQKNSKIKKKKKKKNLSYSWRKLIFGSQQITRAEPLPIHRALSPFCCVATFPLPHYTQKLLLFSFCQTRLSHQFLPLFITSEVHSL